MKILFMNPEAILGGAERSLLDLMWSFRKNRPDVPLGLLLGSEGPLVREAESLGVTVFAVSLPPEFAALGEGAFRLRSSRETLAKALTGSAALAAHVSKVNRTIREFQPTIVHTNGVKSHVVAALAAPPRIPLVWHVRDFLSQRKLGSKLLRSLSWRPRLIVGNSMAVGVDIAKIFPRAKVAVVLNAIDLDAFDPRGPASNLDALAGASSLSHAGIRVGLVATYARWKGQDVLLEAFRIIGERAPSIPIRAYLVGGAMYQTSDSQFSEGELRERARQLGVERSVALVPFQKNPAEVFRALDVVVHASSRAEPFGRTIVEAMACGRAVVGVAEGGAAEIIRPEENALAVPPRNPVALADAILRLVNDDGLRQRLGAAGRADAVARFSRERLAADMLKAYQAIGD